MAKDEFIPLDDARKRKKKKEKKAEPDNTALSQQVLDDDTLTIADVKDFISNAKKKQRDWKTIADRSWNEIEKRNKDGNLYGGNDLYATRRWTRFPLWWSCLKIRQPLVLARQPVPTLKDTQSDDDPFGNTACIIGERLIRSILKTFEIYPELESGRDDFLVTNFGWGRPFYRMTEVSEEEKIRLEMIEPPPPEMPQPEIGPDGQPMPQEQMEPPPPMPPIFLTPDGQEVDPSQVKEDDLGPYLLTGQDIMVENEEIYWEAGLYSNLIVDPYVRKWNKVNELAFEFEYTYHEFKAKFGREAFEKLAQGDREDHRTKGKPIVVFEYWNKFYKECRWLAENSDSFFQPTAMLDIQGLQEVEEGESETDNSDLYGLPGFFPCTEPLSINQSTKHFWPTPEYFQVCDIIDDIHSVVGRMIQLTKAIRIRFFFDSSVTELKTLIGENWAMGEGTGMGIPDLETTLMNNKGSLSNLVAYFPVADLVNGLQEMYKAFQQRLDMFYQITGISDLIRGQTNPDSDKTFGERQMEGKYALNRIEPYQNKTQIWIKNNYELIMQMALTMFADKTIDEYVNPQTMDDEDKQRYVSSLELLKDNKRRRFRVDFDTDATIAINQEWKKSKAIETANVISKMIESTAKVAEEQPGIATVELKLMQHVVGDLIDGKLFIDEITGAIQDAIDQAKAPKEPQPNIDMEKLKLETRKQEFAEQKAMTDDRLEQLQMQMDSGIESAKIQQKERLDGFALQLEQIKMQNEAGASASELNLQAQKLQADIALAGEELANKRNEFLLFAKDIADKSQLKQMEMLLDARVAEQKQKLEEIYIGLENQQAMLSEREKWVTEQRLQEEHKLQIADTMVNIQKTIQEMKASPTPVTVHLEQPKKAKRKRKGRIIRDAAGEATEIQIDDEDEE